MHDPVRTAMMAADKAHKQGGGALGLGQTFGNIASLFGTSAPGPLPGAPAYAQPMAAQAPGGPSVGAPMMPQPYTGGASYNAISQLLGIPVGATAGYTPPTYQPPPVYIPAAQRKAMQPQPFPSPTTGVMPPVMSGGDGDVEAPPEQRGPASFNPLDYGYSGQQRGIDWRDAARLATNIATGVIAPPIGALNAASNVLGGPTVGDMWKAGRPEQAPLNAVTYDPRFQQSQREAGNVYYDPFGGMYKDDQSLGMGGIDPVFQKEKEAAEAEGWEYHPDGTWTRDGEPAQTDIGPIDYGYVPDQGNTAEPETTPAPSGGGYEEVE
jgi:hypothetical protein